MTLQPSALESLGNSTVMPLEFNFILPLHLASDTSAVDTRFLELYPSARVELSNGSWKGEQQSQHLSIFYRITATIKLDSTLQHSCNPGQVYQRNIRVKPTKLADPPLQIQFYPGEFKVESSIRIRNHWLSSIGKLHVSADEPKPLDLAVTTPRASTDVPILLSFTTGKSLTEPFDWTIVVQSQIKMRTFYGSRKLTREPTIHDLREGKLSLRTISTEKETRYYKALEWTKGQFPQNKECITPGEKPGSLWFSTLYATVSLSKDFLPSFLSPLAALRYSVVLKISILGRTHSTATVEVPVQVYRRGQTDNVYSIIPGIPEGTGTHGAAYGGNEWNDADLLGEPPPYR